MPYREVAGEKDAGGHHQAAVLAQMRRVLPAFAHQCPHPQRRQREEYAPERSGDGAGLADLDEQRCGGDGGGAREQRGERQPFAGQRLLHEEAGMYPAEFTCR